MKMKQFLINTVHTGDNLLFIKDSIPDNSIDMIYCDILFGIGKNYPEYADIPRSYDKFASFYEKRFLAFKRVLKDTGNLFIHTSHLTSHWVRVILDNVFGIDNFQHEIIWEFNSAPRRKQHLGKRHETILHYSKTANFYFNEDAVREAYATSAPKIYDKAKYYHPNGKVMGDVWKINMIPQNDKTERVNYPTQKPLELLRRIILMSTQPNDIVADFFSGSGTTLVAAHQCGRNYIGCDINEEATTITKQRLKKASEWTIPETSVRIQTPESHLA